MPFAAGLATRSLGHRLGVAFSEIETADVLREILAPRSRWRDVHRLTADGRR